MRPLAFEMQTSQTSQRFFSMCVNALWKGRRWFQFWHSLRNTSFIPKATRNVRCKIVRKIIQLWIKCVGIPGLENMQQPKDPKIFWTNEFCRRFRMASAGRFVFLSRNIFPRYLQIGIYSITESCHASRSHMSRWSHIPVGTFKDIFCWDEFVRLQRMPWLLLKRPRDMFFLFFQSYLESSWLPLQPPHMLDFWIPWLFRNCWVMVR